MSGEGKSVLFHRITGCIAAASVAFVLLATAAFAHGVEPIKSVPENGAVVEQSPTQVMAQFGEELATSESTLQIVDTSGQKVDKGGGKVDLDDPDHARMILPLTEPLAAGVYTVRYHVVLLDGDATDGAFTFTVSKGAGAAKPQAIATAQVASALERIGVQPAFLIVIAGVIVPVGVFAFFIIRRRSVS